MAEPRARVGVPSRSAGLASSVLLSALAAGLAAVISVAVLYGWAAGRSGLTTFGADDSVTTPLSASIFLLIAAATATWSGRALPTRSISLVTVRAASAIVLALVALSLLVRIGFEPVDAARTWFGDQPGLDGRRAWPSVQTAVAAGLLATAMLVGSSSRSAERRAAAALMAAGAAAVGVIGLVGRLYLAVGWYSGDVDNSGFSVASSLCVLLVAVAIGPNLVAARVEQFRRSAASLGTWRVLMAQALLIPVLLVTAAASGRVDDPGARSLFGLLAVVASTASVWLLWRIANLQHEREQLLHERAAAERHRIAAEASTAATKRFLSQVGHEFKTPLNAIIGFSDLLRIEDVPPEQREMLDHIVAAGHRLDEIVSGVLEITHLEEQVDGLAATAVSLESVVTAAVEELRPLATRRGVRIDGPRPASPDTFVEVTPVLAQAIVAHLIEHAIGRSDPGGRVELGVVTAGDLVELTCTDFGPPIPPERLDAVFEPFSNVHDTRAEVATDGLGLAMTRALAARMTGTVRASSGSDGGATFVLSLPSVSDVAGDDGPDDLPRVEIPTGSS